jgi:hypothetical protein
MHGLQVRCGKHYRLYAARGNLLTFYVELPKAPNEFSIFSPPSGSQCGTYAAPYIAKLANTARMQ